MTINNFQIENRDVKLDLDITNFCLKSHDRVLQFLKTKLMSNSHVVSNGFVIHQAEMCEKNKAIMMCHLLIGKSSSKWTLSYSRNIPLGQHEVRNFGARSATE